MGAGLGTHFFEVIPRGPPRAPLPRPAPPGFRVGPGCRCRACRARLPRALSSSRGVVAPLSPTTVVTPKKERARGTAGRRTGSEEPPHQGRATSDQGGWGGDECHSSHIGDRCPTCDLGGWDLELIHQLDDPLLDLIADVSPSQQLFHEVTNPPIDVIDDGPDCIDGLARRIFELPVEVALAGVDGAGVATTHGDDDVGLPGRLIGQRLGELPERSSPRSSRTATTEGLSWSPGSEPAESTSMRPSA